MRHDSWVPTKDYPAIVRQHNDAQAGVWPSDPDVAES